MDLSLIIFPMQSFQFLPHQSDSTFEKVWGTKYNHSLSQAFVLRSMQHQFQPTQVCRSHCEYLHSNFLILWQWSWFFNKTEKVIYLCLRMSHKNTLWQDKLFWYILILNLKAIKVWRLCAWYKSNWQYQMLNGT